MSEAQRGDAPDHETITVMREGEWYVARDESSGVASQGQTKSEALSNLAEALSLHSDPASDVEATEPDTPWF